MEIRLLNLLLPLPGKREDLKSFTLFFFWMIPILILLVLLNYLLILIAYDTLTTQTF